MKKRYKHKRTGKIYVDKNDLWYTESKSSGQLTPCFIIPHMAQLKELSTQGKSIELRVIEAASDYKMGMRNNGFAERYGGIDELRKCLFDLVEEWEDH